VACDTVICGGRARCGGMGVFIAASVAEGRVGAKAGRQLGQQEWGDLCFWEGLLGDPVGRG
jgi:hypothetical protein